MRKPVLQALILADRIYIDRTGKKVICGTFNSLKFGKRQVRELPTDETPDAENRPSGRRVGVSVPLGQVQETGSHCVFISLTDFSGKANLALRYVALESNEVLLESILPPIEFDDPLKTVELVLPVPQLPQIAGVFAFELHFGDELLGSVRIIVEEMKEGGP